TLNVGNVTAARLSGLQPCTYYYAAVKAVGPGGLLSVAYSNIIEGYSHPEITSIVPSLVAPGASVTVVVAGDSFAPGATPALSGGLAAVESYSIDSCQRMTVRLKVRADAPAGAAADLSVTNVDGG